MSSKIWRSQMTRHSRYWVIWSRGARSTRVRSSTTSPNQWVSNRARPYHCWPVASLVLGSVDTAYCNKIRQMHPSTGRRGIFSHHSYFSLSLYPFFRPTRINVRPVTRQLTFGPIRFKRLSPRFLLSGFSRSRRSSTHDSWWATSNHLASLWYKRLVTSPFLFASYTTLLFSTQLFNHKNFL